MDNGAVRKYGHIERIKWAISLQYVGRVMRKNTSKKGVSGKKKPSVIEDQVLKDGDGQKNFCGERRW